MLKKLLISWHSVDIIDSQINSQIIGSLNLSLVSSEKEIAYIEIAAFDIICISIW